MVSNGTTAIRLVSRHAKRLHLTCWRPVFAARCDVGVVMVPKNKCSLRLLRGH